MFVSSLTLKILAKEFDDAELILLHHLLQPFWSELVSGEGYDNVDVIITKAVEPIAVSKPQIVIPAVRCDNESGKGQPCIPGNGIVSVPCDIVDICAKKFESVLNPKVSFKYSFSTKMPFNYNIIPSSVRSRMLRMFKKSQIDFDFLEHLNVENARKLLVQSFEMLERPLERKYPPSLLVTHDVETEKGLNRAISMKGIEDELDLHSTWFIVSDEYPIRNEIVRELTNGSEIGSHDIRHDGRLIHIHDFEDLVRRLKVSKSRLEGISGKRVVSFRSPLLQFNKRIISALEAAGYMNDFSLPCWESVHPSTMSGFGIEAVYPISLGRIVEHPLTLYQDHQLLNVRGMKTHQANKFLIEQSHVVLSFGGDIVLLIHPDYAYSQDLDSYRSLLTSLIELQQEASATSHLTTAGAVQA